MGKAEMPFPISVDGHRFSLKSPHDLTFLHRFGRVFRVFDHLISGNLCFGVENEKGRYFIKYAGALPENYLGSEKKAVARLQAAAHLYRTLKHPALPPLLYEEQAGSGYLCVFPWLNAYPLGPLTDNFLRMRAMPFLQRCAMLDALLSLFVEISQMDYVAAGIADSHILVDFDHSKLYLCSVDDCMPMPALNVRGRLPGSPYYLAPEAYRAGADLGEPLTVYAMGALAMALIGDRHTLSYSSWEASQLLFTLTLSALQEDEKKRPATAESFLAAWRDGIRALPFNRK